MGRKRDGKGKHFYLYLAIVVIMIQFLGGCTTIQWVLVGKQELTEAKQLAMRGDHDAALKKYEQILNDFPERGDEALFWIGILHAQARAGKSDYLKSLDAFQEMLRKYPHSDYKEEAGVMVSLIHELHTSQKQADAMQKETEAMQKETEVLKQKIAQMKDIEKKTEILKQKVEQMKDIEKKTEILKQQIEQMKGIDRDVEQKKRRSKPLK
jgi:tetratricopeptide (TPR) repeat protein